jgi:hypothetical protein
MQSDSVSRAEIGFIMSTDALLETQDCCTYKNSLSVGAVMAIDA